MLDDLSTQRYCSLFDLPAEGRYRFVETNVLTADLPSLFAGTDAVVHLASIVTPGAFWTLKLLGRRAGAPTVPLPV